MLCLLFGFISGYGRLLVWFFIPGLQGLLLGGVLGFTVGAILAGREADLSFFSRRLALVVGMALAFYGGQLLVPPFVLHGWDLFFLPVAILDGHFREVFTGASINSYTVQQGPLTPGWWIVFQAADCLFFFILALISLGVGLDKQRTRYRIWKPSVIVGACLLFVLATTLPTQSVTSGLLRDWQVTYGGGTDYLKWREAWTDASLRQSAVEQFLEDTKTVDPAFIPQVGVLRALGFARLGDLGAASQELEASIMSAKVYPGAIRVDRTRKVRASSFIHYVGNMKKRVDELAAEDGDSLGMKIPLPQPDDLFPYEGLLK